MAKAGDEAVTKKHYSHFTHMKTDKLSKHESLLATEGQTPSENENFPNHLSKQEQDFAPEMKT